MEGVGFGRDFQRFSVECINVELFISYLNKEVNQVVKYMILEVRRSFVWRRKFGSFQDIEIFEVEVYNVIIDVNDGEVQVY